MRNFSICYGTENRLPSSSCLSLQIVSIFYLLISVFYFDECYIPSISLSIFVIRFWSFIFDMSVSAYTNHFKSNIAIAFMKGLQHHQKHFYHLLCSLHLRIQSWALCPPKCFFFTECVSFKWTIREVISMGEEAILLYHTLRQDQHENRVNHKLNCLDILWMK